MDFFNRILLKRGPESSHPCRMIFPVLNCCIYVLFRLYYFNSLLSVKHSLPRLSWLIQHVLIIITSASMQDELYNLFSRPNMLLFETSNPCHTLYCPRSCHNNKHAIIYLLFHCKVNCSRHFHLKVTNRVRKLS